MYVAECRMQIMLNSGLIFPLVLLLVIIGSCGVASRSRPEKAT